jgi:glycosyltransferase involved in cell wall biosynthesis
MRIGIDATTWWNKRGFGRFTRQLLTAMLDAPGDHTFCLFVDQPPVPAMIRPGVEVIQVATGATVTEAAVADGARSVGDLLAFGRAVSGQKLDVMYFPAVYSWFPTFGAPTVITFHDAIAEHYSDLVFPSRMGRLLWNAKTWLARRTARRITTVSQAARREIVEFLKIPASKVDVILEAADPVFQPIDDKAVLADMRTRLNLPADQRMLVYVGGIAPHKNLLRLVDAFAEARADPALADLILVFVGDPLGDGFHSNYERLKERVETEPALIGRVFFTGFVSDADLVAIYSDAFVVAMPALSEGFGLPAAEAIACGTPVIATRGGAVAEVVGEAGLFFDPLDVAEMAQSIVSLATEPALYAQLQAATRKRAAELSWKTAAQQTLAVLDQVGRGR